MICQIHRSIPKNVKRVSPTEAEIAKYYNNLLNSLKIVFANGMFDVCEALGADYQEVYDAVTLRDNVGKYYLKSSKEFRKFGGACLPKDLSAWSQLVDDLKLPNTIFSAIIKDNTL